MTGSFQFYFTALVIVPTGLSFAICGGGAGRVSVQQKIRQAANSNAAELDLSNRGLTALPPDFGQLTQLKVLWLNGNALTELPPEIGQLAHLTELYLSDNQLTELPPEIEQLPGLKIIRR